MNKSRFKSQALLNELALIACMSYVDLNPIRANICDSLEDSEYTSIKQRIEQIKSTPDSSKATIKLAPFIGADIPKILDQLGLDENSWMETIQAFSSEFHTFIDPEEQLQALCKKQNKKWLQGLNLCRKLFKHNNFCPIPI